MNKRLTRPWRFAWIAATIALGWPLGRAAAIMSEENVAPAEMPTAAASPAASGASPAAAASPAAPAANATPAAAEDWQQVPAGETETDSAKPDNAGDGNLEAGAPDASAYDGTPAAAATDSSTAPGTQAPAAESAGAPSASSSGVASPTESPGADTQTPPALDLDGVAASANLSDAPLDTEIAKADTPALAASLRITEEARKQLAAGMTDEAIRHLGDAVSIDPGNPFEYFHLGRGYIAKKNYTQALIFLKRAEIGFRSRPDWLGQTESLEGACYEELGRLTDAERAYQRALAQAPNNLMARVGYGRLAGVVGTPAPLDAPPPAEQDATAPPTDSIPEPAPVEATPPPPPAERPPEAATATNPPASD